MVNDETINVRVSVLETQMETVATNVAIIRGNYATKQDVSEVRIEVTVVKNDLAASKDRIDTQFSRVYAELADLKLGLAQVKQRLDSELPQFVTKADLHEFAVTTRNWMVGMGVTLFFALAGLQFSMFSLYRGLSAPSAPAATSQLAPPSR